MYYKIKNLFNKNGTLLHKNESKKFSPIQQLSIEYNVLKSVIQTFLKRTGPYI